MGFFRKRQQQKVSVTLFEGADDLDVVGESFHTDNLELIVSQMAQPRHFMHGKLNLPVHAVLKAETDNQYDANAIAVLVGGRTVGHLSRENAAAYRPGLLRLETQKGQPIALAGNIIGSDGVYGVFLRHDPEDFGLKATFNDSSIFAVNRPRSTSDQRFSSALLWTAGLTGSSPLV